MNKKIAFVAMKFDDLSWQDKRYLIIKEVLEEAGFEVIRADEIKTSGAIVDEVCNLLEKSELVVIDSSGDSHSVSYEIGYCHGIKRSYDSTILIRKQDDIALPFNFRHFRHRYYKDLRHLRRFLREWFSISTPMQIDSFGYAFNFFTDNATKTNYGSSIAKAMIDYIHKIKFTGRCEYYAGNILALPGYYVVCLGLKYKNGKTPENEFWGKFTTSLTTNLSKYDDGLILADDLCEYASIRAIKANYLPRGIVEFDDGVPQRIINPESIENDSWFIGEISSIMNIN